MIWNDKRNCGFSKYAPWLPIPISHKQLSVQMQNEDKNSVLNFTRKFMKWRKNRDEIIKGNYEFITTSNCKIIDLIRHNKTNETHCIFNLSDQKITYKGKKYSPYSFNIDGFNS